MNKFYVLVGVPGSGKTTWVNQQSFNTDHTVYVSSDMFVERYAQQVGKTYTEVFAEYMPRAIDEMMDAVFEALENRYDIIWDQTSTTRPSRRKKLKYVPEGYEKIAVVFPTPDPATHKEWLKRPGKEIPEEIVQDMIARFEMPTLAEGFDKVIEVRR
jgi:tRNA uridine 5-carbamoylmethylation protein Kti12